MAANRRFQRPLAKQGAEVIGADLSEGMLALAKRRLPQLRFVQGDAVILPFEEKFDTAFSNAVFYWIPNQEALGNWVCQFYENHLAAMPQASAERVLSGPEEIFPILWDGEQWVTDYHRLRGTARDPQK